jgi:S1-C subfamily serine protease
MQDFYNVEGQLPIDEKKSLEFVRGTKILQVNIRSAALRDLAGDKIDPRLNGARFEELPTKLRADRVKGVLLAELDEHSVLARNGLRVGDIVTGANRQIVQSLADLQHLVQAAGGPILLQIRRNGGDYIARID